MRLAHKEIKMEYSKQVKPKYSQVLREFREKNNYTQTKVAKALGVRQATISDWENGKSSARDFLAGVRFAMLALKHDMELEDLIMSYPDQTTEHE
jgi:transcriptional regulator with XRE-family HTH domain